MKKQFVTPSVDVVNVETSTPILAHSYPGGGEGVDVGGKGGFDARQANTAPDSNDGISSMELN